LRLTPALAAYAINVIALQMPDNARAFEPGMLITREIRLSTPGATANVTTSLHVPEKQVFPSLAQTFLN
jgi:hypothetical protein